MRTNWFDDDNGFFAPFSESLVPASRLSQSMESVQASGFASKLHRLEFIVTMILSGVVGKEAATVVTPRGKGLLR